MTDGAPRSGRSRRGLVVGVVAGLVVGVVVAVGVFVVVSGSEDEAKAEVFLAPAASGGEDPFTDSVATEEVAVKGGGVKDVGGGDASVESVEGSTPQLYGGTGDQAVCDQDKLAAFLKRNPEKGRAFASVVGVAPSGLDEYIAGLTPVVLREDTRVTNHGFADGRATSLQSVLQAGTAVLVDRRGVPRVRCACGNPLSEPVAVSGAPAYSGDQWQGFDAHRLVAVHPAAKPVDSFELVNVNTGKPYTAGGAPIEPPSKSECEKLAEDLAEQTDVGKKIRATASFRFPLASSPLCHDFTGDERFDVAFAIEGGGSGGAFNWAVFRHADGADDGAPEERFVEVAENEGGGSGGRTAVELDGDLLVVTNPIYGPNDPQCCPTGGESRQRYRVEDDRVVAVGG